MSQTVRIPIDLRAPGSTINAGNAFWKVDGLTAHDFGSWQFLPDVDGSVFGVAHVPKNIAGAPTAKIVLILAANNAGGLITSMDVLTEAVASDAESINPGSLTAVGVVDITMPSTVYLTKEQSFTLATQPSADDLLLIEIFHDGNKTEDTLSVNTILVEAFLEIDIV